MIGNNACGSRALGYGRTADNVGLTVARRRLTARPADGSTSHALVDEHLGTGPHGVRPVLPPGVRLLAGAPAARRTAGPSTGSWSGREGTLAVVRRATVRLVEDAPHRVLVVLGFPSMADAADAVPGSAEHDLVACEGLDERITGLVPRTPRAARGQGLAARRGDRRRTEAEAARQGAAARRRPDRSSPTPPSSARCGGSARTAPAWPPARLTPPGPGRAGRTPRSRRSGSAATCATSTRCSRSTATPARRTGTSATAACTSGSTSRSTTPAAGPATGRSSRTAAGLAASHGGSLSGEHGDGRARSELLPTMYSAEALALMGRVKALCDPDNLLNPGVLVDAAAVRRRSAAGLRASAVHTAARREFHRCTGVGKCLADNTGSGGVMCPSYLATRDEKDSTRGRARVLQERGNGHLRLATPERRRGAGPVPVLPGLRQGLPDRRGHGDVQGRGLHEKYRGRRRPRSHYTLGRLPAWSAG